MRKKSARSFLKKGNDNDFKKDHADLLKSAHQPVLLNELIDGLSIKKGNVILDATVNGGGHSSEICRRYPGAVTTIGLDVDSSALKRAAGNIPGKPILLNYNFRNLDKALAKAGVKKINRAIFDLGLSSDQLQYSGRGFSFLKDEPLLMTFADKPAKEELTADDVVNRWQEENIALIIKSYGEERFAGRIAKAIVAARPVKTSKRLAEIIRLVVPLKIRFRKIHPATRVFQAIRMAVNDELNALSEGLAKAWSYLSKGGRLAVISFHSLEDRMVKRFIRERATAGEGKVLTKKPITPNAEEISKNPRARSAKLRIIEKTCPACPVRNKVYY